jgi:uncharacterized membrane protein (UPF0127 family)
MRSPVILGLAALAAMTCQRVEEPQPAPAVVRPAETAPADTAPDAAPTDTTPSVTDAGTTAPEGDAADAGRCIRPLAEPPPPPAKPASTCPADTDATPPTLARGSVVFPDARGAPAVTVEIADTPATEARGLMFRTELAEMSGMIFVWSDERTRTFWMRNTCLPLDMLFLAKDGTIVGILEQVPTLNDRPRSVGCPSAYVLEVNAGWTRKHGIKPGMKAQIRL